MVGRLHKALFGCGAAPIFAQIEVVPAMLEGVLEINQSTGGNGSVQSRR